MNLIFESHKQVDSFKGWAVVREQNSQYLYEDDFNDELKEQYF